MNPQTVRQTAFKIGGLSNIYKLQGMTGGFWNTRVVPKDLKMTNWRFFTNPFEKYAQVKLDHLPRVRGENKKRLKPPPSNWLDMNWYSILTTRRWQKQDTQMLNMLLYMYELHKLGVNLLLAILCDLFGWLSHPFRPFKGFPRPPTRGIKRSRLESPTLAIFLYQTLRELLICSSIDCRNWTAILTNRENDGTLGMVPLIINHISSLDSEYLLGISPVKGLLGGG